LLYPQHLGEYITCSFLLLRLVLDFKFWLLKSNNIKRMTCFLAPGVTGSTQ
jgi:hypothetical protein